MEHPMEENKIKILIKEQVDKNNKSTFNKNEKK
jgi:hypothetical protein